VKKSKAEQLHFYRKVVKLPIYGGNFIIIFSNDIEKVSKLVNIPKRDVEHLYAYTFHNFLYGGYESWAVCFNLWDVMPVTTGTIIHEITHAGNRILSSRNVLPDWDNDEAECYLKGWLADEVVNFMKKSNLC
jgi:hypothetical protein